MRRVLDTRIEHAGRTGVVQIENATQMKWRSLARNQPPVQIRWAERLGIPSCPYVVRWMLQTPLGSLRVHHWLSHDDDRAFHDHPWWFLTVCVRGGYDDVSPHGVDRLRAGSVRLRHSEHQHTVYPRDGGAWTVMVTGRRRRRWGFWFQGKFVKANKWFARAGHHPCD